MILDLVIGSGIHQSPPEQSSKIESGSQSPAPTLSAEAVAKEEPPDKTAASADADLPSEASADADLPSEASADTEVSVEVTDDTDVSAEDAAVAEMSAETSATPEQPKFTPKVPTTTPSIKDALSSLRENREASDEEPEAGDNTDDNEEITDPEEPPAVSREELTRHWSEYIERIKEESPRIYLALSAQPPELLEDGMTIRLTFRNNALLSEFKQHYKISMLAWLKETLNNNLLEFEESVPDIEENGNSKYYTNLDKLKYMIEKNPSLQKLRQEFNLDFE